MAQELTRRTFLTAAAAIATTAALTHNAKAQTTTTTAATTPAPTPGKSQWRKAIKTSILMPKEIEAKLTLAKECGFDGVEWDQITTIEDALKIQELARKIGVPCHGVVYGGWHTPLSSPDDAVIKKGLDGMRNAIECAAAMEVETCLLVPAVVNPEVNYRDAYQRSQKNVRQLIPHAEKHEVTICLENVWNKFLLSPMEFARYIDEIDSPWVRMYFDTANSLVQSFSEHWLTILGSRIRKIDVKDYNRSKHAFVPLGDGDANWPAIKQHLIDTNYTDYITQETNAKTKEELMDAARRIDQVLG